MDGTGTADFARRTLRLWAVLDAVQAAILLALTLLVLPAKFPAANVALCGYALSLAAPAWWLARGRAWAWWLAIITSLLGLAGAGAVIAGLIASWAYLRAVYGAFGFGASIASLLLAGMVWQVLGLYPAVRLRALLRREVRAFVGIGRRQATTAAVVALVFLGLPLPLGLGVHAWYALAPVTPVSAEAMAQALAVIRRQLTGGAPPAAPALERIDQEIGPVHATLWRDGRPVARAQGEGPRLAEAIRQAGGRLAAQLRASNDGGQGRLKIDRVVARGPVPRWRPLLGLALDPGLDGLEAGESPGVTLLPDDLLVAAVAGAAAPLPQLDELRLGVDARWLEQRLGAAGKAGRLRRIRVESWIEALQPGAPALPVHRGQVLATPPSAATAAALAGDFILRQVESDGRFSYRYDPLGDLPLDGGGYSIPRHAGTAYGLVLLHAIGGQPRFRDAARDALGWLALQIAPSCGGLPTLACIAEGGRANVGASALSAVAMLEYQRRTGDRRYQELAWRLLAFLRQLQRPSGDFAHDYDAQSGEALPGPPRMFVSEQAALALVLGHRLFSQTADREAAERALDFLTGPKYDFFLGRFIYGADHWTCIAAEEAWPALRHRRYLDFCSGYARFMSRLQYPAAPASPARDFAGHYGFSYLLVPQAPATAGFTEALLSTLALAQHHRAPSDGLRQQSRAALAALVQDRLRPETSYFVRNPARAEGAFRRSLVEPEVRIDFVQHAASALIRGHALGVL